MEFIAAATLPPRALVIALAQLALASAGLFGALSLAVRGVLTSAVASLLVPVAFVCAVVGLWNTLVAARWVSAQPPLLRRRDFWLVVLLSMLVLPRLGSFGLIDPWESHYAEVAREMLARRDPISMWWGHQGWFMSKPVLTSWLEALALGALGANVSPGAVLGGDIGLSRPEWAVRLPGALFALGGCFVLFRGVSAHAGRTAGFGSSLVLASAAQWTLASRHALTDTPFTGALTAALGFLLLAWSTSEDATFSASRLRLGKRSLPLHPRWLLVGCIVASVGGQLAWLVHIGIDLDFSMAPQLRLVTDVLTAGSPGNCNLPSQPACTPMALAHPRLLPALQALLWTLLLAPLLWSIARERRTRRLLLLAGWLCMGLATLAKGIAGFALPLAIAGTTLLLQRRWREPWRSELVRGAALLALLVLPWFVAAYARHGRVIFDELVLRHMIGRTLEHLHDTNAGQDVGVQYYLWQLAYATFPWTGFVPAALAFACVRRSACQPGTQRALDLASVWLVVVFALFTFMRTKFHHYILPAVPAVAVLVGVYLADARQLVRRFRYSALIAALVALCGALLTARIGADFLRPIGIGLPGAARFFHLLSYRYDRPWPSELDFRSTLVAFICALALIQLGFGLERWARAARAVYTAVALVFAAWLGQRYLVALGPSFGQRHVIEAFERSRTSAEEPLVAYQLNWKGENFYTGNRLAIFVTSAKRFRRYVKQRRHTDPTLHVVLETRRLPALRAELGDVKSVDVLTGRTESDKICLVRVRLY